MSPGYARGDLAAGVRFSQGSPAVLVSDATRVEHPYRTDRGQRMLPAWSLQVEGSLGPVIVLDDAPGNSWRPASQPHAEHWYSGDSATATDDGSTLTYQFVGSPAIYTDYPDARVLETATAVAIAPRGVERPSVSDARLLHAETRTVTVRLDRRLGRRVLVTANGLAVTVSHQG